MEQCVNFVSNESSSNIISPCHILFFILFVAIFEWKSEAWRDGSGKEGFPSCFLALYVSGISKTMNLFPKRTLINDKTTFFMSRWFHSNMADRAGEEQSCDCIFNPQTIHNLLSIIFGRKKFFGKLAKPLLLCCVCVDVQVKRII